MGLIKIKQPIIVNDKRSALVYGQEEGKPLMLNERERAMCAALQPKMNQVLSNAGLGYEVSITTLTAISKKVSAQVFYEVPPADYVPMVVGEGSFMSNITTYRSYEVFDTFETGVINLGTGHSKSAAADAAIDALNIPIFNWKKGIEWNIFELEVASRSGNWDLVSAKEKARKMAWDLGVQRVAFLGLNGQNGASGSCYGLLNQPSTSGVNVNSTVITEPIKDMSPSDLKQFVSQVIEAYRANCNRTMWPTHFIIPESDWNGLTSQASADFPIKSTLELLQDAFRTATRNKNFEILPLAYCDNAQSGLGYQQYVLMHHDEESVKMTLPLDYTTTLANTINGFDYQNVAYGQLTGVLVVRPLSMLYFQFVLQPGQ